MAATQNNRAITFLSPNKELPFGIEGLKARYCLSGTGCAGAVSRDFSIRWVWGLYTERCNPVRAFCTKAFAPAQRLLRKAHSGAVEICIYSCRIT
jgi:hypothetical protein